MKTFQYINIFLRPFIAKIEIFIISFFAAFCFAIFHALLVFISNVFLQFFFFHFYHDDDCYIAAEHCLDFNRVNSNVMRKYPCALIDVK